MMWDIVQAGKSQKGRPVEPAQHRHGRTGDAGQPAQRIARPACPDVVMGTGYGMTETSGSVAMSMGEDFIRNRASAGRILSHVELRIEGPDGTALPAGEVGRNRRARPDGHAGLLAAPRGNGPRVLSPDGWLKTGDVGLIDPEGYIFIVDRAKDMVISGGENIYCAEVERIVNAMPEVVECAAFGIADERLGELLVARVVGDNVDAAAIIAEVADKLARYKAPAQVRVDAAPLPRNDVGKIDKKRLRTEWTNTEGNPA